MDTPAPPPSEPATPPWAAWEEPEPPPPARRTPWLLVAGVVPWLVLAVVLAGRGTGAAPAPAASADPVAGAVPGDAPLDGSAPAGGVATAPTTPPGRIIASGGRTAPDEREATAAAVVVARAWLTGVGPALDLAGARPEPARYAEHLVVEAIDHPAPGAVVVTVLAVLLHAEGDRYDAAEVRRLAVPLWFDADGARPAGAPWALPAPTFPGAPPATEPVADPDVALLAADALDAAGYAVDEVVSIGRTDGWPLVATVVARAPGRSQPDTHVVWLRRHLGRLVVAGTRPTPAPTSTEVSP